MARDRRSESDDFEIVPVEMYEPEDGEDGKDWREITEEEKSRLVVTCVDEIAEEEQKGLLRDTRIKLDFADSGRRCIELAEKGHYDCILLDQMMPEMNGEETLREMKKKGLSEGIPIIALTADAVVGARESYLAAGFSDYVSKPVKYAQLEETLKKHLPAEKQRVRSAEEREKPTILLWGTDPEGDGWGAGVSPAPRRAHTLPELA